MCLKIRRTSACNFTVHQSASSSNLIKNFRFAYKKQCVETLITIISLQNFPLNTFIFVIKQIYSKVLRCTTYILLEKKKLVEQNICTTFVNLGKMIKKPYCSRFSLHKFIDLKSFWTQCALARSVQLEAVYLEALLQYDYDVT